MQIFVEFYQFGPVEKAIYHQALSSARQKKSSLNGVGDSNSLVTQVICLLLLLLIA